MSYKWQKCISHISHSSGGGKSEIRGQHQSFFCSLNNRWHVWYSTVWKCFHMNYFNWSSLQTILFRLSNKCSKPISHFWKEVWEACPWNLKHCWEANGEFSKVFTLKPKLLHSDLWLQTLMMIFSSKHTLKFSTEKDNSDSWKMPCTELFWLLFLSLSIFATRGLTKQLCA